ncbi:ParB/RepB/Spo0J family partition protein [Eupransor demetentiae]|uniref:Contains ParB-like nuclease domain (Spo0J) n=1 Tax=Eupransor demetentiae TaxID=3109584 RepID=A0ABP0EMB8_9LACO|nr:Chromosome segregation protein Spo0J [Lactobacillaceae bacterium LMG 33000]
MVNKKGGLGKGMDSLFGANRVSPSALEHSKTIQRKPEAGEKVEKITLSLVDPNPFQPREHFDQEALQELANSIKENGLLTPIIVRQAGDRYQIIAGERRVRASKLLKLRKIDAIVRKTNDDTMATLALIENLQRDNLNPIEEAHAFDGLLKQLKLNQTQLAEKLGKERTTIANSLRLLKLPDEVQDLVQNKELSMGQARALLGLEKSNKLKAALKEILGKGLNVRQVEQLVKRLNSDQAAPKKAPESPYVADLSNRLEEKFGTKVRLQTGAKGKGKIEIDFLSNDDLARILALLEIEVDQ